MGRPSSRAEPRSNDEERGGRDGAIAIVIGLLLGLGTAVLADALDNTVKSAEEIEEIYGVSVLATVSKERSKKREAPRLALVQSPFSPGAEAYRVLRNNLGFINFQQDMKTILVTSASPDEGKSTIAANLAVVLSEAGKKVALVVCDFHRPAADQFFEIDQQHGLSSFLGGVEGLEVVLQQPAGFDNLWVLPAGGLPPNPSELLGSSKMEQLVASLRDSVDWVILDSAPLLAVADTAAAVRWVDGVLIATRATVTTRDAARRSRSQLEHVGARILGVVLWSPNTAASGGDSYFQGYNSPASR